MWKEISYPEIIGILGIVSIIWPISIMTCWIIGIPTREHCTSLRVSINDTVVFLVGKGKNLGVHEQLKLVSKGPSNHSESFRRAAYGDPFLRIRPRLPDPSRL